MKIVESWENHNSDIYTTVRHSKKRPKDQRTKGYESSWLIDGELNYSSGIVGS